jgi:hypothetical protein
MVAPGIVAVGRSGGMIFEDATGFLAVSAGRRAKDMTTQFRWDHGPTSPNRTVTWSNGSIMRRAFAMAAAAISLAGCSSFSSSSWNYFKSDPTPIQVQLESTPPGADARTSLGPGCKTPCSVSVTPPDGSTSFLVNYSMPGKQPAGVPVNIVKVDGGMFSSNTVKAEPNPVVAELQPIGPPPKSPGTPMRPKRKKPATAPADATDQGAPSAATR